MLFYRLTRLLFRILATPMFRFEVEGAERVPASGAGVVVAPHRSWLDPACVGGACPRPVRFLIMDKVYRRPWLRWFFRAMLSVPVRPGGVESGVALRSAVRLLKQGHLVGIFPEGRVFPEESPGKIHPGAALLAVRVRAPVIPVEIHGSAQAWPHGRRWPGPGKVSVRILSPIDPPPGTGREAVGTLLREIERTLRDRSRCGDAR